MKQLLLQPFIKNNRGTTRNKEHKKDRYLDLPLCPIAVHGLAIIGNWIADIDLQIPFEKVK